VNIKQVLGKLSKHLPLNDEDERLITQMYESENHCEFFDYLAFRFYLNSENMHDFIDHTKYQGKEAINRVTREIKLFKKLS